MTAGFRAFRFELDPSNAVRSALAGHAGAARFAFDWGRALVIAPLGKAGRLAERARAQGATAQEAEALRRTVVVGWSLAALRREWNRAKQVVAPWWAQNSKEAYNSGIDGLARALDGWSKSRRGARRGRTVGFPRRKKHRCLAERSYRCDHCGVVIDRDLNAALNLAALADAASGTGSGPGTDQADLADAQGEERSMASARCSSTNCEDGASPHGPDKTATATRQRAAPKPVLIGSDR